MDEQYTFEAILQRMLDRVPDHLDKREASIIYIALAPAATELAQMYIELDVNRNLSFADTATGELLRRRCAEHGVNWDAATKARRKGLFFGEGDTPIDIPIGSRYSIGELNYLTINRIEIGIYELECEVAGVIGNEQFGALLPIEYVNNLARAELVDVLIPGTDDETDESLRAKFYEQVNAEPFGGNIDDYKQKINSISGVGGVKVFPTWQGGGTVKCTVISSSHTPLSTTLIEDIQTIVDPEGNQGQGLGLAPIGHTVTIQSVEEYSIDIETTVTLSPDITIGQVITPISEILDNYFLELRKNWSNEDDVIVRLAQVDARILNISGIVDVMNTKLNGVTENVQLGSEEIPVIGQVSINE